MVYRESHLEWTKYWTAVKNFFFFFNGVKEKSDNFMFVRESENSAKQGLECSITVVKY